VCVCLIIPESLDWKQGPSGAQKSECSPDTCRPSTAYIRDYSKAHCFMCNFLSYQMFNLKGGEIKRSDGSGTFKSLWFVYFRCCVKEFEDMKMTTSIFSNQSIIS